jgi:hypothetical protein
MTNPVQMRRPEDFPELAERARRRCLELYVGFAAGVGRTYAWWKQVLRGSVVTRLLGEGTGFDRHVIASHDEEKP